MGVFQPRVGGALNLHLQTPSKKAQTVVTQNHSSQRKKEAKEAFRRGPSRPKTAGAFLSSHQARQPDHRKKKRGKHKSLELFGPDRKGGGGFYRKKRKWGVSKPKGSRQLGEELHNFGPKTGNRLKKQ